MKGIPAVTVVPQAFSAFVFLACISKSTLDLSWCYLRKDETSISNWSREHVQIFFFGSFIDVL